MFFASEARRRPLDRLLHDRTHVHGLHAELQLPGHDAAHVEEVLDELGLGLGVALRSVSSAFCSRSSVRVPVFSM
jgi:hypothetical protein